MAVTAGRAAGRVAAAQLGRGAHQDLQRPVGRRRSSIPSMAAGRHECRDRRAARPRHAAPAVFPPRSNCAGCPLSRRRPTKTRWRLAANTLALNRGRDLAAFKLFDSHHRADGQGSARRDGDLCVCLRLPAARSRRAARRSCWAKTAGAQGRPVYVFSRSRPRRIATDDLPASSERLWSQRKLP